MEVKPGYLCQKGYKQTEVGVIPEEWDVKSLGQMAELTSSKRIFESDYVPFGIPFYRGKEISMLVAGEVIDDLCYISEARFAAIRAKFGAPVRGDILITAVGTLANVYVVNSDEPFYFKDGNLIWLRGIKDVEAPFLGIQLRRARAAILDGAIGTSQKALTIVVLRNVKVATPPLPEQRAIATALSDVDGLLGGLDRLIAKKRDLKQAAMQQLLTGQTRLPGFHGEWEVKRLGEICEIAMGRTPPRLNQAYWGHGYKWLSIADLQTKVVSTSNEEITELAASMMTIIPKGTLLMSFKLSLGRLCFAGCDLFTNEAICSFNKLQASAEFLYYVLGRTDFSLYGKQAVKGYTLNKESLKIIEVTLPPLPEQTAIAEVLTEMDAELAGLEQRREKTRALKQAMMQELLTGRTRLVSPDAGTKTEVQR